MKEKNSKLTIILVVVLIMIISIVGLIIWGLNDEGGTTNLPTTSNIEKSSMLTGNKYVKEEIEGLKINTSDKIKETKNMDGIEIKITQLTSLNNYTTMLGTLKNTTNEIVANQYLKFDFYTERDVNVGTEYVKINSLNPGEQKDYDIHFKYDNVSSVEISMVNQENSEDV